MLLTFGLSLGSFVGACAYRIPRGISILAVPSSCPNCQLRLTWSELLPIVSFAMQRGRCLKCSASIPWRYPLTEIVAAGGTVVFFQLFGVTWDLLLKEALFLIMFLVCLIDWEFQIIPNMILVSAAIIGIFLKAIIDLTLLPEALTSAFECFVVVLSVRFLAGLALKRESLGMGDVKLAGLLGLFLGLNLFLVAFWGAAVLGALYGLTRRLGSRSEPLPLGSFLAVTSVLVFTFDREIHALITAWYNS